MSPRKKIVVGVDGSEPSLAALRWAAETATSRGQELLVLMAWLPIPLPPVGPSATYAMHDAPPSVETAKERLLAIVHEVLGADPPIVVQPVLSEGNAAKQLIDASHDAELLVVGTRGLGGFVGMMLGSVSQHVAVHATCTVVIVR